VTLPGLVQSVRDHGRKKVVSDERRSEDTTKIHLSCSLTTLYQMAVVVAVECMLLSLSSVSSWCRRRAVKIDITDTQPSNSKPHFS
jgi:hypothetical protein